MPGSENLFDVVAELRQIVADLNRTVYGDSSTRNHGLMDEFDAMRSDLKTLQSDVNRLAERRPHVASWIAGYLCFVVGMVFVVIALINQIGGHQVMGLQWPLAAVIAVMFCGGALLLFMVGFGWFEA